MPEVRHASAPVASDPVTMAAMRAWQGPWADLPAHVRDYPTMLTREELRMLRWLAREYYSGAGCICDLGAFLGGSTMALADGYMAAGHRGRRIHSFDRHLTNEAGWQKYIGDRLPFPPGGNFLPLMPQLLGPRHEVVAFHSGDFPAIAPPDEPVELLFVDIAKAPATSDHVVHAYFPKLIPGRSIVIQQDYFHPWPIWDVVVMEVLADYFRPLAYTEQNSALFLNTAPIPPDALEAATVAALTLDGARRAIVAAARHWPFMAQKLALNQVLRILEAEGDRPLAERKEWQAKQIVQAQPFDRAAFEAVFVGGADAA